MLKLAGFFCGRFQVHSFLTTFRLEFFAAAEQAPRPNGVTLNFGVLSPNDINSCAGLCFAKYRVVKIENDNVAIIWKKLNFKMYLNSCDHMSSNVS